VGIGGSDTKVGLLETMTDQEFRAFIVDARAEATAALARLATVDPDSLAPELRSECDAVRAGLKSLLAMTEADVVALHLAACEHAGRELTPDELRCLLTRDSAGKQEAVSAARHHAAVGASLDTQNRP
jgi:hypothetical protein